MTDTPAITTTHDLDRGDAVLALAERARSRDGVSPLNEAALLAIANDPHDPAYAHVLATGTDTDTDTDTAIVGYLFADLHPGDHAQAELVVDPDSRRRGVGSALLTAFLDGRPDNDDRPFQVWAHGDLPGAARLGEKYAFAPVRTLLKLATELEPTTADPPAPDGITIRTFVPGRDDTAWLDLNARAFASHPEQGSMTARDLDQRIASEWFDPAGFFLAERDGRLVGFHWTKVEGGEGEVYVVGVDPDAQGLGLGSVLTQTGLHYLAARGVSRVTLYVEGDNAPALAVYRKLGFAEDSRDVLYRR